MNIPVRLPTPEADPVEEALYWATDAKLFRRDPRRPAYCHAFKIRSQRPGYAPQSDGPAYASRADAEEDAENYRRQWRGKTNPPTYEVIEVYTAVSQLVRGTRAGPLFGTSPAKARERRGF